MKWYQAFLLVLQLLVNATTEDGALVEEPMKVIISVIDMNDNKPVFQHEEYQGNVQKSTPKGRLLN